MVALGLESSVLIPALVVSIDVDWRLVTLCRMLKKNTIERFNCHKTVRICEINYVSHKNLIYFFNYY